MLRVLSRNIKLCYQRALRAERLAAKARTPDERRFYLDEEKTWLALAASYDHQARLESFLQELRDLHIPKTDTMH